MEKPGEPSVEEAQRSLDDDVTAELDALTGLRGGPSPRGATGTSDSAPALVSISGLDLRIPLT